MRSARQAELTPARRARPGAPPAHRRAAGTPASSTRDAEPFWPAQLTAAAALVLYLTLPHALIMGPRWLVPGVEGVLLYLAIYLVTTIGAFACILAMRRGGHMVENIADLSGLAQTQPAFAFVFATGT